jgi:hypothetical protein
VKRPRHLAVLAGQLATAIRKAELFRQLPMAGALAPLAERRRRWQRLTRAQRMRWIIGSAVAGLAIAAVPWPRGVAGQAQVLPAVEVPVRAETGGILREVAMASGQHVSAGLVVARLDEVDSRSRLAEMRAGPTGPRPLRPGRAVRVPGTRRRARPPGGMARLRLRRRRRLHSSRPQPTATCSRRHSTSESGRI